MINLTIDNRPVSVKRGTSVLHAAAQVGIKIPSLCYMKLEDLNIENKPGGCRVCVVVQTHSMRAIHARRTVVELILSDHPTDCLKCAKAGNCDLQSMAQHLGIREIHYQGEQSTFREDTSPAIIRDLDKCIRCLQVLSIRRCYF